MHQNAFTMDIQKYLFDDDNGIDSLLNKELTDDDLCTLYTGQTTETCSSSLTVSARGIVILKNQNNI